METSPISGATDAATRRRARRGLAVFFVFIVLFSVIFDAIMFTTGNAMWILALMGSVALSSVIARLVLREGFADVSFRFGGRKTWKYIALAPIIPTVIGLVSYGIAWATGLAQLNPQPTGMVASIVGDTASPITIFLVMLVLAATIGAVTGAPWAAGEELGWRGYMLTRLIDAGVPRPVLVSGIIWGLWHLPLVLGGLIYTDSPPVRAAVLFMVAATSFNFVLARMRLETGSIWPSIATHSSYNSIIQTAFAPATTGAGAALWVGMEAGILVVLATIVVAVIFSRGHWAIRKVPEAREGVRAPSPAPQT